MQNSKLHEAPETSPEAGMAFASLYELTKILRSPEGCPWDCNQTPQSMRTNLLEEAYEAVDAMTQDDVPHVKEELGDVLFNAMLLSYMYEQRGDFTVADVSNSVLEKLVRRHPHVFSSSEGKSEQKSEIKTGEAVVDQWDRIKENVEKRGQKHILDEVPDSYPPLLKARKYMDKAAKKGFDWPTAEDALKKLDEERREVGEAAEDVNRLLSKVNGEKKQPFTVKGSSPEADVAQMHLEEELGDMLLAMVNVCRKYNTDPAIALDRASRKFYKRFCYVEDRMEKSGEVMSGESVDKMLELWNEAKKFDED